MTEISPERLLGLREKIEQQRKTIKMLQREGHLCPDAERQLRQMLAEFEQIRDFAAA
jgi:hypothetical protein